MFETTAQTFKQTPEDRSNTLKHVQNLNTTPEDRSTTFKTFQQPSKPCTSAQTSDCRNARRPSRTH
eukprot:4917129-Heterocapsa_arctica.AAC.1